MCSLVTSTFLSACESLTLTAELQRRTHAMETRRYRKILRISYKDHVTRSPCQDPAGNRTTRRPPDRHQETQTAVVWTCLPLIRSGQNYLARHSERGEEDKAFRRRGGKTTSGNGRAWSSPSLRGKWRTEKKEGNWLWSHLWCPNDPRD